MVSNEPVFPSHNSHTRSALGVVPASGSNFVLLPTPLLLSGRKPLLTEVEVGGGMLDVGNVPGEEKISIAYGDVECMPDEELVRVPKTYLNVNRILECSNSCIMSPGIFANLSDLLAGSVVDCNSTLLAGWANASTETSERVYGTKDPDAPELLGKISMLSVKPVPIPVVISLVWKSRSLVFQFLLLVQWVEDDFHNIPPLRTLAHMKLPFRCLTSTKNSRSPQNTPTIFFF
ncbi:hypothetical protein DFH05DRAFT_1505431 [Lentinula detonsa]|uniref:Uncharacterized protein n=1 Tax=Lentinula detonsa TaxID=2804962 RepID=A0A9W8TV83_9AGAR|nr:hypothetical protein DFH05DRAFT_1505431 [Lentinula detonsa]